MLLWLILGGVVLYLSWIIFWIISDKGKENYEERDWGVY